MLWKRKALVVAIWIIGSIIAVGVVAKLPSIYKSEALVLVESQKIPDRYVTSTVNTEVQDRIATINQDVLSNTRLLKVISEFNLFRNERKGMTQEEMLDKMRANITFTLVRGWTGNKPGAFRIAYEGTDPAVIAQVTNKLAQLYIDENMQNRENQAEGTSEFMSAQLDEAKKRLDEMEAKVSQYKQQHNGELPQQETAISGGLSRLDAAVAANRDASRRAAETRMMLETNLTSAEANLASIVTAINTPPPPPPADTVVTANGVVVPKQSEVLQQKLDTLRSHYSDDHPEVRRAKNELAQELRLEAAQAKGTSPATASSTHSVARTLPSTAARDRVELNAAKERVATIKAQITALDNELEARKKEEERLTGVTGAMQGRLERLPLREQDMAQITRDYDTSKNNYKILLDKKMAAEMSSDMERRQKSERFTLVDAAQIPEKPYKPNRPLFAAAGSVVSLALGLLTALALGFRHNTLLGEWEFPKSVPILGRVPYIEMPLAPAGSNGGSGGLTTGKRRLAALTSTGLFALMAVALAGYLGWKPF